MSLTIAESVLTAGIDGVIRLSDALSGVGHAGTLGLLREALVESVICPLLPPPLKAATGVVIDCAGNQSGQCDIIIWDDSIFRPFYFARGAGLFGIESVVGTIEVKSTLTSESEAYKTGDRKGEKTGKQNHFAQVLRNAARLGRMRCLPGKPPFDQPTRWDHPANLIFAFKTSLPDPRAELERICGELTAGGEIEREASFYVQGIVIPGRPSAFYGSRDDGVSNGWMTSEPAPDLREVRVPLSGFLNCLPALAAGRGRPRIGNYTGFHHGPT